MPERIIKAGKLERARSRRALSAARVSPRSLTSRAAI